MLPCLGRLRKCGPRQRRAATSAAFSVGLPERRPEKAPAAPVPTAARARVWRTCRAGCSSSPSTGLGQASQQTSLGTDRCRATSSSRSPGSELGGADAAALQDALHAGLDDLPPGGRRLSPGICYRKLQRIQHPDRRVPGHPLRGVHGRAPGMVDVAELAVVGRKRQLLSSGQGEPHPAGVDPEDDRLAAVPLVVRRPADRVPRPDPDARRLVDPETVAHPVVAGPDADGPTRGML